MGVILFEGWPYSIVVVLCLINDEVRCPYSIMNESLSVIPLFEVVSLVFLVSMVDLWGQDHLVDDFSLLETLFDQKIVL